MTPGDDLRITIFPFGCKMTPLYFYELWPSYQERFENGDCDE